MTAPHSFIPSSRLWSSVSSCDATTRPEALTNPIGSSVDAAPVHANMDTRWEEVVNHLANTTPRETSPRPSQFSSLSTDDVQPATISGDLRSKSATDSGDLRVLRKRGIADAPPVTDNRETRCSSDDPTMFDRAVAVIGPPPTLSQTQLRQLVSRFGSIFRCRVLTLPQGRVGVVIFNFAESAKSVLLAARNCENGGLLASLQPATHALIDALLQSTTTTTTTTTSSIAAAAAVDPATSASSGSESKKATPPSRTPVTPSLRSAPATPPINATNSGIRRESSHQFAVEQTHSAHTPLPPTYQGQQSLPYHPYAALPPQSHPSSLAAGYAGPHPYPGAASVPYYPAPSPYVHYAPPGPPTPAFPATPSAGMYYAPHLMMSAAATMSHCHPSFAPPAHGMPTAAPPTTSGAYYLAAGGSWPSAVAPPPAGAYGAYGCYHHYPTHNAAMSVVPPPHGYPAGASQTQYAPTTMPNRVHGNSRP